MSPREELVKDVEESRAAAIAASKVAAASVATYGVAKDNLKAYDKENTIEESDSNNTLHDDVIRVHGLHR